MGDILKKLEEFKEKYSVGKNEEENLQEEKVEEPKEENNITPIQPKEEIVETVQVEEIAQKDTIINYTNSIIKAEEPKKVDEIKVNEENEKYELEKNKPSNFDQMYEKLFGKTIKQEKPEVEDRFSAVDIIKDNVSVFEGMEQYQKPAYKYVGIVFDSYIIVELEKEMYIINLKTAQEKVLYENLKKNYFNQVKKDSQMLLLPDIIEVTYKHMEIIKENKELLAKAGFCIEEFGENTIKLMGVPTICYDLDTKNVIIDILEAINTVARTAVKEKEEKFLATVAEKIVSKANVEITVQDVNNLMDRLLSMPEPFTYDINKPMAIKMTKYDIERKFSRK